MLTPAEPSFTDQIAKALEVGDALPTPNWQHDINEEWPSWYAVSELASASLGAASAEISALGATVVKNNDYDRAAPRTHNEGHAANIDARLASLWFGWSIHPEGWQLPAPWDAIAGDYATADGWIKLHTNAPHHREAALNTLMLANSDGLARETVASAVLGWNKDELEQAIVDAGGCAAAMRSDADWRAHPQGRAVEREPLIVWQSKSRSATQRRRVGSEDYPLQGLRVLDLTRVLAGPVASRFLARFGADVLRVDPPLWEEPGVIPEVTLGKRCCGLDLTQTEDRKHFDRLLQTADILLHGYRPGALAALGYDREACLAINAELIDVSLCAYGHSGPWATRRGFDSLVQMSCGIADWGMQQSRSALPQPLPVQALDHATGYLMAAAAVRALRVRNEQKNILQAKLSLARTARLLATSRRNHLLGGSNQKIRDTSVDDLDPWPEHTAWGPARRLRFPARIGEMKTTWHRPASELRSTKATWL